MLARRVPGGRLANLCATPQHEMPCYVPVPCVNVGLAQTSDGGVRAAYSLANGLRGAFIPLGYPLHVTYYV